MRPFTATVAANEPAVGGLSRLSLHAPGLSSARAGQWLALTRPEARSILAQPFPLAALDARSASVDVLYDRQAAWLASLAPAGSVDVLGPWGRPFTVDRLARHVVLLGAERRLLGLLALAN